MNVKEFVLSDDYVSALCKIQERTNIRISDEYETAYFEQENLRMANLTIADVTLLLKAEFQKLIDFSVEKLVAFNGVSDEEEYPEGEEPDEDDEDNHEIFLGYDKGFFLDYMIEYYIMKNRPETLDQYLKRRRIPGAKKYAKDIRKIYNEVIS